jgi:hypothetical protein
MKSMRLPLKFSEFSDLVHLSTHFAKSLKCTRKKENMKIERQLLVHMSALSKMKTIDWK